MKIRLTLHLQERRQVRFTFSGVTVEASADLWHFTLHVK